MTRWIGMPALAAILAGCVPAPARVIVPGPSAAQAEVTQHRGRTCVVLSAARTDGCYDGVSLHAFAFSADGTSTAYPAQDGGLWSIVHDGRAGAPWPGVGTPVLSPDGQRLAYPAWDGRFWRVVVDGAAGAAFDLLLAGSLAFDPTGRRFAYAIQDADSVRVVLDGAMGVGWDAVGRITFSPSGDDAAWAARRGAAAMVALNGVAGAAHDEVSELVLGEARYAYAARDGDAWRVVHGILWPPRGDVGSYGPFESVAHLAVAESVWYVVDSQGRSAVVRGGEPIAWHDGASAPVLGGAPDAWAYIATDGDSSAVIIAGRALARWPVVREVAIAADGKRHAYVAADSAAGAYVIDDAGVYPFARVVEGTLHFSLCGYWSALALPAGRDGDLRVVVDGVVTETRLDWPALVRFLRRPDPRTELRSWLAFAAARARDAPEC